MQLLQKVSCRYHFSKRYRCSIRSGSSRGLSSSHYLM